MQVAPERIEVDVAKDCPKGKWLLYSWKDARAAESAADIASRVTVSGGAADRARIVTEEKKVFLKVRGTDGLILILR